jgi:hypothetical protein
MGEKLGWNRLQPPSFLNGWQTEFTLALIAITVNS